ncbi:hypothetical protein CRENBAI_003358 [Crenichthys baileyi]|uniref:Uncharacterized protein n=1 Tax=Crenichthys baileyi TaxID=28760 RepID=A0AAV9RL36_9TELE
MPVFFAFAPCFIRLMPTKLHLSLSSCFQEDAQCFDLVDATPKLQHSPGATLRNHQDIQRWYHRSIQPSSLPPWADRTVVGSEADSSSLRDMDGAEGNKKESC